MNYSRLMDFTDTKNIGKNETGGRDLLPMQVNH
jgi:hypothetical protein